MPSSANESRRTNATIREADSHSDRALLKAAARLALACTTEQRATAVSAVIDELLIADELGLAYQLARCVETQEESTPAVSSQLIRTLLFARVVRNSDGPLGNQLRDDLKAQSSSGGGVNRSNSTHELFLRAATLIPALVLDDSPTVELLRSFPLIERQPQLSNLCIRVALACRRLAGKTHSVVTAAIPASQWQQAWESLKIEIRSWMRHELDERFDYQPAKPIFLQNHWTVTPTAITRQPQVADRWAFWQLGVTRLSQKIARLLNDEPLRQRNAVAQLLQSIREESTLVTASVGIDSPDRFEGFRQLQQSAIVLVERWLRLMDRHPETNRYLPQDAIDLRAEILKRSELVNRECQDVCLHLTDRRAIAGVECCRHAVRALRDRIADTATVSDQEPQRDHLLSADLLRVPHLVLDQRWTPLATPESLQRKLLETIANGLPNWQTALATHRKLGNRKAVERIEQLMNGKSNAECETQSPPNDSGKRVEATAKVNSMRPRLPDQPESHLVQIGDVSDEPAWIWDFESPQFV